MESHEKALKSNKKNESFKGPKQSKQSVRDAEKRFGKRPCEHCGRQLRPEQSRYHSTCMLAKAGKLF